MPKFKVELAYLTRCTRHVIVEAANEKQAEEVMGDIFQLVIEDGVEWEDDQDFFEEGTHSIVGTNIENLKNAEAQYSVTRATITDLKKRAARNAAIFEEPEKASEEEQRKAAKNRNFPHGPNYDSLKALQELGRTVNAIVERHLQAAANELNRPHVGPTAFPLCGKCKKPITGELFSPLGAQENVWCGECTEKRNKKSKRKK